MLPVHRPSTRGSVCHRSSSRRVDQTRVRGASGFGPVLHHGGMDPVRTGLVARRTALAGALAIAVSACNDEKKKSPSASRTPATTSPTPSRSPSPSPPASRRG